MGKTRASRCLTGSLTTQSSARSATRPHLCSPSLVSEVPRLEPGGGAQRLRNGEEAELDPGSPPGREENRLSAVALVSVSSQTNICFLKITRHRLSCCLLRRPGSHCSTKLNGMTARLAAPAGRGAGAAARAAGPSDLTSGASVQKRVWMERCVSSTNF